ncbi:LysR family transcriptional regulator [Hydrogenophaga sp.]|uniref:LysR family transcriptional regulator n=1 Tax=Hydrogenophaga sp. TaxID=1904254 RepID=UPI002FCC0310
MPIDFLGIQAFLAIVECGSFQLAAAQLNLSQTAVSHRMRKLEETLGVRLIARTTREVSLTDAGRALLPRARNAVQELGASCETVRKHGQNANNWLVLACLPTLASGVFIDVLREFHARWPDTPVRVFDSSIHEIIELVDSRIAAFGISVMRSHTTHAELDVERIGDEPFVLLCPEGHALAGRAKVPWEDLRGEALIRISMTSGNSITIDESLGVLREQLRWRLEAQHTAMAVEMVRGGLGLTVVPLLVAAPGPGVVVVPLEAPVVARTLAVLTRRDAVPSEQEVFVRERAVALIQSRIAAV